MILCKGARKSEHPKGKVPRTPEGFNDILTSISSSNWENCCFLETFLGGPGSSSRSKFAAKADVSLSERRLRPLSDITAATRASDGLRDLPEVWEGEVVRGAVVRDPMVHGPVVCDAGTSDVEFFSGSLKIVSIVGLSTTS